MNKIVLCIAVAFSVAGCNTWSTTNIEQSARKAPVTETQVSQVMLSPAPFDPAKQAKIQDLKVAVNKTTAFHPEPTVELVQQKLREDAAKLGANAVMEVKISEPQVSWVSWGSRYGTGVAVRKK